MSSTPSSDRVRSKFNRVSKSKSPNPESGGDPAGSAELPASPDFTPPKPNPKRGGAQYHKPGCKCPACMRRNGQAAAVPRRTRPVEQVKTGTADNPDILYAEPEEAKALAPLVATGRSARDRVAQWIYYRAAFPGITTADIARKLGITPHSLNRIVARAREEGWLQIHDPLTRIEHEILPKVVQNVNDFLDAKDQKVTIEAMKGFLVPLWKDSQGIEEDKVTILGIKIDLPESPTTQARGQIVGTPRTAMDVIMTEVVDPDKSKGPEHG